jgi:thiol-disulfide isomerase/thioredoxin
MKMISKVFLKKWLKEIFLFLAFLFFASLAINFLRQPDISPKSIYALNQNIVGQNKIYEIPKNKPFIVVFWGSWCPVCKQDLDNFSKISNEYDVLGVAVDSGSDSDILNFLKNQNISLKTINDRSGEIAGKFNISAYPTTLIYDSKGNLKFTEVGYITTAGLTARLKLIE